MSTLPLSARKVIHSILLFKGCIEQLTNGVFAIAMTLLVLGLRVPDLHNSVNDTELLRKIGEDADALQLHDLVSLCWCSLHQSRGRFLCHGSCAARASAVADDRA